MAGQEGLDLTLGVGKPLSGQGGLHGLYRPDLEYWALRSIHISSGQLLQVPVKQQHIKER